MQIHVHGELYSHFRMYFCLISFIFFNEKHSVIDVKSVYFKAPRKLFQITTNILYTKLVIPNPGWISLLHLVKSRIKFDFIWNIVMPTRFQGPSLLR